MLFCEAVQSVDEQARRSNVAEAGPVVVNSSSVARVAHCLAVVVHNLEQASTGCAFVSASCIMAPLCDEPHGPYGNVYAVGLQVPTCDVGWQQGTSFLKLRIATWGVVGALDASSFTSATSTKRCSLDGPADKL